VVLTASDAGFKFLARLAERARFPKVRDRKDAVEQISSALLQTAPLIQQALLAGSIDGTTRRAGSAAPSLVDRVLAGSGDVFTSPQGYTNGYHSVWLPARWKACIFTICGMPTAPPWWLWA